MAGEKPAARATDMHTCPESDGPVPHIGGPIITGSPNVLIGGLPAARVGDPVTCVGPLDTIAMGSTMVLINGMPAARMGDQTAHGGVIVGGMATVLIGMGASGPAIILAADTTTPQPAPLMREQVYSRLQDHTTNAARKVDQGPDDQVYSARQLRAIEKNPKLRPAFRGYQIDKDARGKVESDPDVGPRITGRPNKGPDFIDKGTGDQYDMTTQGQLQAHKLKYGDDLIHLDTSGDPADSLPAMPSPKIAPASPQGPPPDTAITPEDPDLPIIDDILPLP
jgi:uncharacterized Zn-binding protein involved in type VI secretion